MSYHQFHTEVLEEETPEEYGSFEVFYVSPMVAMYNRQNADHGDENTIYESGWYWWACFPGCLPDGDWSGPFNTEQAAINDARGD